MLSMCVYVASGRTWVVLNCCAVGRAPGPPNWGCKNGDAGEAACPVLGVVCGLYVLYDTGEEGRRSLGIVCGLYVL